MLLLLLGTGDRARQSRLRFPWYPYCSVPVQIKFSASCYVKLELAAAGTNGHSRHSGRLRGHRGIVVRNCDKTYICI